MINVKIERELAAPADRVWALLADFGNIDWFPGWDRVEVIGDGVGMTRRIHMKGLDNPIEEILESLDHDRRQLSYTIPNMPMPVTEYRAQTRVEAAGDDRCTVTLQCTARPDGIAEADAQKLLDDTYSQMLDRLATAAQA